MGQIKYVNYKKFLTSWDQMIRFLGITNPGRLAGYDTINRTAALTFQLLAGSVGSGIKVEDPTSTVIGPWGVWVTKQGAYVTEDGYVRDTHGGSPVDFTITANGGGPYTRYDWIYGKDTYVAGTTLPAVYGIIAGDSTIPTEDGPPLPTLTDPYHQTLLGYLAVPYGASDVNDCTWNPLPSTACGNGEKQANAKLGFANQFRGIQQWVADGATNNVPELDNTGTPMYGFWLLSDTANQQSITPNNPVYNAMYGLRIKNQSSPVSNGTKLTLLILGLPLYISSQYMPDGGGIKHNMGYRPIYIPEKFVNFWHIVQNKSYYYTGHQSDSTVQYHVIEFEMLNNVWVVTNITFQGNTTYAVGNPTGTPSIKGSWQFDLQVDDNSSAPGYNIGLLSVGNHKIDIPWVLQRNYNQDWAQISGVALNITKSGTYRFGASVRWGFISTQTSPPIAGSTYPGPGNVELVLKRVRAATADKYFSLDYKNTYDLVPYFSGNVNAGINGIGDRLFKGEYVAEFLVGDILSVQLIIDSTDALAYHTLFAVIQGSSCFYGHFLGKDFLTA